MRRRILTVLACAVAAGCATPDLASVTAEARGDGGWTQIDDRTLRFEGYTEKSHIPTFERLFTPSITRIVVNSGGGDIGGALPVALRMQAQGVELVVDGVCVSSCANYFFVAARTKVVRPGSLVLFHGGPDRLDEDAIAEMLKPAWAQLIVLEPAKADDRNAFAAQVAQIKATMDGQHEMQQRLYAGAGVSLDLLYDYDRAPGKPRVDSSTPMFWAPPPARLRCYGVDGIASMWHPQSQDAVAALARRYEPRLVIVHDVPSACADSK